MTINNAAVTIIIPAFNEAKSIGQVIQKIKNVDRNYKVIVIDDGSKDDTVDIAKKAGAKVIRHPYNIGNGAAIKTGIRNTTSQKIVMMDADRQHQPEDIPKLVSELDKYHMVIGARNKNSKVSPFRQFGNIILSWTASFFTEMNIPDLTSGFRAVRRENIVEFLDILPNKFSYPTTITLAFIKKGYFIKFLPLDEIQRRQKGRSKLSPFRDAIRFLLIILKIVTLFDPLKIFFPISVFFLISGIGILLYQYFITNAIRGGSLLFILTGIFLFFFGLLASQNATK